MRPQEYKCLTVRYKGRTRALHSPVKIGPPVDDHQVGPSEAILKAREYVGIWDTGATGCVVSEKVISECQLVPITFTQVHGTHGTGVSPVYRVSLFLPNGVSLREVHVTRGKLIGCDVLIGMDIIGSGDFAISTDNAQREMLFSFRHPSRGSPIDFVPLPPATQKRVGRNDPCPCGSGLKYKKCCGRSTPLR